MDCAIGWSTAEIGRRPEFAVRRRFCRLQAGVTRPFAASYRALLIALSLGAAMALVATNASRSPLVGSLSGFAAGAVVILVAAVVGLAFS
jgi:hypothetical protein